MSTSVAPLFLGDSSRNVAREVLFKEVHEKDDLDTIPTHSVWGKVFHADNLEVLSNIPDSSVNLIYVDPPFNTGKDQIKRTLKMQRTNEKQANDRVGFGDKRYSFEETERLSYQDSFDNYLDFLSVRMKEAKRVLTENGSLFVHLDWREVHYVKVMLDNLFGRESFINEIIWAYDYGGRSKSRWSAKHDTILFYAKNPKDYVFNYDIIDRIPYLAPSLVGPEKAERGKTPTDVWWHTIVPTNGKEKTGYPTQKPLGIIERIVKVHSNENDIVLDFFAGSGTIGEASIRNNRRFILVDSNPKSIEVIKSRLTNRCRMEISK